MTSIWNHIHKHPRLYGSLFWNLLLKGACKLLGSLIKPDGLDDSWLDSWLTDPASIYSHKYVDEPETISLRKSTLLNIFRKLNVYGWPSLWAAKMPKSVSYGHWMVGLSAGEPWTSLFLWTCAKTASTTNYRPISHFGGREEHVRVIDITRVRALPAVTASASPGPTRWCRISLVLIPVYLSVLIDTIWGQSDEVDTQKNMNTLKYMFTNMHRNTATSVHE